MTTAGGGEVWTGPRLAAQLVALNGAAPDPVQHVIYRATRLAEGTEEEGYAIPGEQKRLKDEALDLWLARNRLAGADRLAVAVLVIRETLDSRGLITQCTLERRRGSFDGPFCGDPARVDFAGAAGAVRLYRSHLDGRLTEIAPSSDLAPPHVRSPEQFAGEHNAVRARFGEGVRILDSREPTLFEDMIGLSSVIHVRAEDGREVGCGIGWHGSTAFVLEADFPRFAAQLDLLPEDEAAVAAALGADRLVRGETRLDEKGIAVVARRRGSEALFLLRPQSGQVRIEPHEPVLALGGPDQQRWMRYIETYEEHVVLDAWHDGASDDLIVLTGDPSGQVWGHHVDTDGVETWRKPDDDAAVGALHREHLFPGTLAAADEVPASGGAAASEPRMPSRGHAPADDSLLGRAEAYMRAMASLREARETADGENDIAALHVGELRAALVMLEAHGAAQATQDTLTRLNRGAVRFDALADDLTRIEDRLRHELAVIRSISIAPPRARFLHRDEPLGAEVAANFPSAGYDIEEASVCLAFRRPTAAVFHCMKILERGIGAFARCAGLADPLEAGARHWLAILRHLREAEHGFEDVREALELVRRRWGGAILRPADKYTEEEAELIFQAVGGFIRALAVRCDEQGGRIDR
jgi:hypothetical protein